MVGPDSSYSPLEIHICWKVLREDRIEPFLYSRFYCFLRIAKQSSVVQINELDKVATKLLLNVFIAFPEKES
jgi:hypothetical protein